MRADAGGLARILEQLRQIRDRDRKTCPHARALTRFRASGEDVHAVSMWRKWVGWPVAEKVAAALANSGN